MTLSLGLITPEITRLDLNGLGMSDAEAQTIGRSLVNRTLSEIRSALASLGDEDRKKVIIAYLAAGGDPRALETAISTSGATMIGKTPTGLRIAWGVLSAASLAASAYHGYKRNRSIGWAIWWGAMGSLFPVVTPAIAVAQGFGKPKRRR